MPAFDPGGLAPASASVSADDRLDQAEAVVRDFCGWHVSPQATEPIDIDGSCYRTQVLRTRHLVSVSDVTLDGAPLTEGVHFAVDPIGILRRIDGLTFAGRLTLSMTHGYSTPPPAVQAIIADLAKVSNLIGAGQMQAGPFLTSVSAAVARAGVAGLSDEQRRVLSRYALEPGLC